MTTRTGYRVHKKMNLKSKIRNFKSRPCCVVAEAAKSGADRVCWPAVYVGSMAENRNRFEERIAWLFEFRATFRDGSKKFMVWKAMGLAGDKAVVYERLKRRADASNIVLIEMCNVSPAMDEETTEAVKEINKILTTEHTGITEKNYGKVCNKNKMQPV